ncbi:MAG TPA: hypothetical protein VMN36_18705 [Verrucomicrobiales bacterium]|nr:hypothetical protein [Verrucomicrobiales bacterium]
MRSLSRYPSFLGFCTVVLACAAPFPCPGGESALSKLDPNPVDSSSSNEARPNLWTGENVSLGGVLFPHFHFLGSLGASTADDLDGTVVAGHHDPNRDGFTVQNVEMGASLRLGDSVRGFATYAAAIDLDDEWSGGWEEVFGKLENLPGGFELRGGRYFNRLGFANALHPHGYFFVDKDLVEARMFGEDGITSEGAELTWRLPTPFTSLVSYSYGEVFVEDEGHAHGDAEHAGEALFEIEGAGFAGNVQTLHWINRWNYNDFHQFTGHISAAWGENFFRRDTILFAGGLEYLWRQNGFEPGGKHLRLRASAILRDIGARSGELPGEEPHHHHEEEEEEHEDEAHRRGRSRDLREWGAGLSAELGFAERWETGLGLSWVEGIAEADVPKRCRLSPILVYKPWTNTRFKLQYNYDHLGGRDGGDEHSIWLGLVFNWGGAEVR